MKKPDFTTVLMVLLAIALVLALTFDFWLPHH
jgi:hypothetical protein